ncbi:hypothetical protein DPMN_114384 [Dreissena polymorpha]|uniref:Uncharacterized protein n=1 Tax=Dreissena polymorpha TaxID=45954 RepID=A0A9D4KKT7_DREPO|nr:hypothetical protein DPMN_114384 [Dreissena polymorpha]
MQIRDWKRVLTSSRSKSQLTKLYTECLTLHCHDLLDENQEVYVAGGMGQIALKVTNTCASFLPRLYSDQKEADYRMLLHVAYSSGSDARTVVVVSPDTDVFACTNLCRNLFTILATV